MRRPSSQSSAAASNREAGRWVRRFVLAVAAGAVVAACSHPSSSQPAPAGGPDARPAPAGEAGRPRQPGRPGGPEGAPRRRQRPSPMAQDTARRAMVDSILRTIAGRENEPAGKVFKNVKLLAAMPAGEFLRNMDENYGRGLGWTCNNCHTIGQFELDTRKNKRIARQMQQMTDRINRDQLAKVKELDEEYEKVTCVMCHRGTNEPKGRMPVPAAPAGEAPR